MEVSGVLVQHSMKAHMSTEFIARRRMYEGNDTKTFHAAITIMAKKSSQETLDYTAACGVPAPTRIPTPTRGASLSSRDGPGLPVSSESVQRKRNKLSEDARPIVPQRTSSIHLHRGKHLRNSRQEPSHHHRQQSNQIAAVTDKPVASMRDSAASIDFELFPSAALDNLVQQRATTSLELPDPSGTSETSDDSPLAYTLSRKRTSLPSLVIEPKLRLLRRESQLQKRDSQVAKRESIISIRDRASFLSSFPQPPKSPPPKSPTNHHRTTSSRYFVFPPTNPESGHGSKPSSPTRSLSPISPVFACSRGNSRPTSPRVATPIFQPPSPCALPELKLHPNPRLSFPPPPRQLSDDCCFGPVSSASTSLLPQAQAGEDVKITRVNSVTRKVARKIAPGWMLGSFGSQTQQVSPKHNQTENQASHEESLMKRFSMIKELQPERPHVLTSSEHGKAFSNDNENLAHRDTLRKRILQTSPLKEKTSSTSNLLSEAEQQRETYAERWEREMGQSKKRSWKKLLCF